MRGDVPDEVRELAADVLIGREPQQLYLGGVDMAVRALDRCSTKPGAEPPERPGRPLVAVPLGRRPGRVEMLVDAWRASVAWGLGEFSRK